MAFLHSAQLLYTDCGYPRWSVCFTLPNAIFFYMLFNDFYKVSTSMNNLLKVTSSSWWRCGIKLRRKLPAISFTILSPFSCTEILHEEGQSSSKSKGRGTKNKNRKRHGKRTNHARFKSQRSGCKAEWEQERELKQLKSLYVYFSVNFLSNVKVRKMKSES